MTTIPKSRDLIIFGQLAIDFFGEQIGSTLPNMLTFKKYVGGFGGMLAIGARRLGLNTAIWSQIGQDEMGQAIINSLKQENVDVSQLRTHTELKTPIRIRAVHNKKSFPCETFDSHSAYSAQENPMDMSWLATTKLLCLHSQDLNTNLNTILQSAAIAAQENQASIALVMGNGPINRQQLQTLLPLCSLIFMNESEIATIFNLSSNSEALNHVRSLTHATIVVKNCTGCYLFNHAIPKDWQICYQANPSSIEHYFEEPALEAFTAGFLSALNAQEPYDKCCQKGLYCAQIVQSRQNHSDALPTQEELSMFIAQQHQIVVQTLKSHHFEHIHYVATRPKQTQNLFTFSFGYHEHWEKIAKRYNASEEKLNQAKFLIAKGIGACQSNSVSIICDERPQMNMLELFSENWIARTVEVPNEIPLRILSDEVSHLLLQWPKNHGAKVTVVYHPDDKYVLRGQQESVLGLLYRACRATHHELLVEISPPSQSLLTPSTYAHIIRRFYEIGIYPDWWQISAPRDGRSWDGIQKIIEESDKHCKGVIVSAQHANAEQIKHLFQSNAPISMCKGFVIGKNIIQNHVEDWLAYKIADSTLVEKVTMAFENVIALYTQASEIKEPKVKASVS